MGFNSIGDLARAFQSSRQIFSVKSDLHRLSQELASGRRSNISTTMSGDYQPIVGLERSIAALRAYDTATAEASQLAEIMQAALGQVQDNADQFAPALLTAGNSQNATMIDVTAVDAFTRLSGVLSALNTNVANRFAFSGVTTDMPALADAATILADLGLVTAALTDAASVEAAVDVWFDTPGGGYDTVAYTGATTGIAPVRVAEGQAVDLSHTAARAGVRAAIKGFAMAALVGQGVLAGNLAERAVLTQRAGEVMLGAQANLSLLRGEIGTAEARIDAVKTASATERHMLELARVDIVAADPYRTATELEAVRGQLDMIFTVTARLSRLSLSEYLR